MNKWKWQAIPRHVPVPVLAGRSHINDRLLARVRELRAAELLPEETSILDPDQNSSRGRGPAVPSLRPGSPESSH